MSSILISGTLEPQASLSFPLTQAPLHSTMAHMQYIVERFHAPSLIFPTREQAFEFAMECGDFAGITVEEE